MKNGTATGNDHNTNIEILKAEEDTISKTLTKLYTKLFSERQIPTAWKNAKMVIIFKKGNMKYLNNYRPICLLSNIYKVHTKSTHRPRKQQASSRTNKDGYEITDRHCVSPPVNPTRGRPARRWRDELDNYWNGTIWQRIAQDRQMWKQQAEAFAQLRDTVDAQ